MSRTVLIQAIRKIEEADIPKFEYMTRKEIFNDYKKILALFESEYMSEGYAQMKEYLTKIKTFDGVTLYVAHTKFLLICSDYLLANEVEARIQDYVPCTYRDITELAGQLLSATEIRFKEGNGPDEIQKVESEMRVKIPEIEDGVHIFFFDDMN